MKGVKLGRTTVFFVVEDFQLVDFWEWASAFIILGSGWLGRQLPGGFLAGSFLLHP